MPETGAQCLLVNLRQPGQGTYTLTAAVYNELRQLAHHYLGEERSDHTLQATALVHEIDQRLIPQQQANWQDRGRFICAGEQPARRCRQERDPERLFQLSLRRVFE
jgi:hypothetical protein